ncbi:secretin and TonB N terminus short domain protein [Thermosipho africanus H17ap60334]|jgi:hypothetical protein|uniref:energy transducer TonB n=1 Tax=Thermosipho TaxID=2420 RepID=UPI00028D6B83|nr:MULTISPECIES: energy transducer TonB [Thermosipho]EKF49983.1 secretin and TonB N terminus short domain protein [Thermosipho africanus H17ap60334]MDK2900702.1 hypothetical protein [Thermosipho sp. (in: thermotogales)]RDI90483.1 secretin and TonB N terminus short domain protein [Thermosipho africanus Ob7]
MKKITFLFLLIWGIVFSLTVSFYEQDIKEALNILSLESGKKIVYEPNLSGIVSIEIDEDLSLEEILDIILLPYNYYWVKYDEIYFVGVSNPESPGFFKNAKIFNIPLRYKTASELSKVLPKELKEYILYSSSEDSITVFAPIPVASQIANIVSILDVKEKSYTANIKIIDVSESYLKSFLLKINYSQERLNDLLSGAIFSIPLYGNYLNLLFSSTTENKDFDLIYDGNIKMLSGVKSSLRTSKKVLVDEIVDNKISKKAVESNISFELTPYFLKSSALIDLNINLENIGTDRLGSQVSTKVPIDFSVPKVIGAYSYLKSERADGGLSFLMDLPIIGNLFKQNFEKHEKRYILFVLRIEEE